MDHKTEQDWALVSDSQGGSGGIRGDFPSAIAVKHSNNNHNNNSMLVTACGFKPTLYRQPSLLQGNLSPAAYRHCQSSAESPSSPLLTAASVYSSSEDVTANHNSSELEINDLVDEILSTDNNVQRNATVQQDDLIINLGQSSSKRNNDEDSINV